MKIFKNKKMIIVIFLLLIAIVGFIIFKNNAYKKSNAGNNINEKITLENANEYILNIKYYEAKIEVTINSNKNSNKYIMEQKHNIDEDYQKVLEPANLQGMEIIYKDNNLKVKNTALKLSKIYKDYPYIDSNILWLNSFVKEYKNSKDKSKKAYKDNENIVIEVAGKNEIKKLYINEKTGKPEKMSVEDQNKNTLVYIIYNEITLK